MSVEQTFDHVVARETQRSNAYTDTLTEIRICIPTFRHVPVYAWENDSCIVVSDTWASGKSIPVQGVSLESQLVPESYAPTDSPWSRETSSSQDTTAHSVVIFAVSFRNSIFKVKSRDTLSSLLKKVTRKLDALREFVQKELMVRNFAITFDFVRCRFYLQVIFSTYGEPRGFCRIYVRLRLENS